MLDDDNLWGSMMGVSTRAPKPIKLANTLPTTAATSGTAAPVKATPAAALDTNPWSMDDDPWRT